MFRALLYAYVLGGLTFIPLVIITVIFITVYTSVPVGDQDPTKPLRQKLESEGVDHVEGPELAGGPTKSNDQIGVETNDLPKTRKGWLTMRRTFEESTVDGGYVTIVRSFLDARSKDPKRSRPKDMWYVVLKGKVLYLYEDEEMTECEAVVELGSHNVVIYPEGQLDAELFAKRNAICLKPKDRPSSDPSLSTVKEVKLNGVNADAASDTNSVGGTSREREKAKSSEVRKTDDIHSPSPWFIFVRSNVEMEDWYLALVHASDHPVQTPTLHPLQPVFQPTDMNYLVTTLDDQPDSIPMRWLNALIGRIFFSYYRTHTLEAYIIGRLMKKLAKVKRPAFLTDVVVTEVSVGNKAPVFSKPMLKELTKEGDASMEVHFRYKGEFRITLEATALINLGQFKSYTVKLVLAAVLKELEGNLLIKIKRPPSNRIWYAFTQSPRMVLQVEPIVSDRQIKWGMILSTIESKLKEIIQESVVMPNMDDIAFFESLQYQHRGGIWSDASRSARRASTSIVETETVITTPPDSQHPTLVSTGSSVTEETSSECTLPSAGKTPSTSQSEDDESCSTPVTSLVEDQRITTTERVDLNDRSPSLAEEQDDRSSDNDFATPLPDNLQPQIIEPVPDLSDANLEAPAPTHSRRSSTHSMKSMKSYMSTNSSVEAIKGPDTSQKGSNIGATSSFLSTLKSKAGDKQILGNTARETIRKWGVNWGNFKKELSSAEDTGDLASRLRSKFENAGANNRRASYLEVRAAVAERKEREHEQSNGVEEMHSSGSSSPIRGQSDSRGRKSSDDVGEEEPTSPTAFFLRQNSNRPVSPRLTPTKSQPSTSLTRALNNDADILDDVTDGEVKHLPIAAQPQAKTMIIPGIHASHRGEVMSMGYIAPQPNLSPGSVKPTMQNVYRLWRKPGAATDSEQDSNVVINTSQVSLTQSPAESLPVRETTPRPTPPPLPPRPRAAAMAVPSPNEGLPESVNGLNRPSSEIIKEDEHVQFEEEAPLPEDNSRSPLSTEGVAAITTPNSTAAMSALPPPLPSCRISTSA